MFPGLNTRLSQTTIASAASVSPLQADLVHITGSTAIATIVPPFGGFSGIMILVPVDGTLGLLTTGNISVAVTMAQNRATVMVYSKKNNTWYPGAIS